MPVMRASVSVLKFVLLRNSMIIHPYNHDPSQGLYSYVMDNLTFWCHITQEGGSYSYYFMNIKLHFFIEFSQNYLKIWLDDVHKDGRILMIQAKEIHYRPRTLVEICKKYIMENFEMNEIKKMKEIVPDMKF